MSSPKEKIIELTRETLESSSIHAIPNITKNKFLLIKIIWLVCFLASAGVCSWFISKSISDYFNFDVVSQIDIKYANKLEFPIVSICDLNTFVTENGNFLVSKIYGDDYYPDIREATLPKLILNYGKINYIDFDRKEAGRTLDQIIIKCYLGPNDCNLTSDFEYFFDVNYGNCFRYNSGKDMNNNVAPSKYISQNGLFNALTLDLNVGKASENNNYFSIENGYIIFINNERVGSASREGIQVSSGLSTRIVLDKYTITKPPKPYTECTSNLNSIDSYDSEIYRKTFSSNASNKKYHYSDCAKVCLQKLFAENCTCQSLYYDFVYDDKLRKCTVEPFDDLPFNINDANCEAKFGRLFYENTKYIEECDCPFECEKTNYIYTTSVAEFPTYKYAEYLNRDMIKKSMIPNNTFDYQNIKQSVARVYIYYDEMKQTIIKNEIKTQLADLVSNIGGTLGLFLGLSFLSIIEFVEILMQIILVVYHNKRSNRSKSNQITASN